MSGIFTKDNPSPKYIELLEQYKQMHKYGDKKLNIRAENTFSGFSLNNHFEDIQTICKLYKAKSIFDYGSGKGYQYDIKLRIDEKIFSVYDYWGVDKITLYDPNYPLYDKLPNEKSDGVVCTDVLEHIPEDDLDWVLENIFRYAKKFVFLNTACYPALKYLPNGENTHCTVKEPKWWTSKIQKVLLKYPKIGCKFIIKYTNKKTDTIHKLSFSNIHTN
jgi:hypothetical protein